ncbi:hypothetical protein D3C78_1808720 [compost metagenome]
MVGMNPQAQAQHGRPPLGLMQAHVFDAQQPRLAQPVIQPKAQRRVSPHHVHIQGGGSVIGLAHFVMYV